MLFRWALGVLIFEASASDLPRSREARERPLPWMAGSGPAGAPSGPTLDRLQAKDEERKNGVLTTRQQAPAGLCSAQNCAQRPTSERRPADHLKSSFSVLRRYSPAGVSTHDNARGDRARLGIQNTSFPKYTTHTGGPGSWAADFMTRQRARRAGCATAPNFGGRGFPTRQRARGPEAAAANSKTRGRLTFAQI